MLVRTIEQYLEAKAKGLFPITMDASTPQEVRDYIIRDMNSQNKIALANEYNFKKQNQNYVYDLNSRFNFGKHKGNELRNVYKCNPNWIEWAILNASGFVISDLVLDKLLLEKVFNIDDLSNFFLNESTDELHINLTTFKENKNGFLFHEKVREEPFYFKEDVRKINSEKARNEISTSELFKGGNWGAPINFSLKRLQKKTIRIIT